VPVKVRDFAILLNLVLIPFHLVKTPLSYQVAIMPHSIPAQESSTPGQDPNIAGTETENGKGQTTDAVAGDPETNNGTSQEDDAFDDMDMVDVGAEGDDGPEMKTEAKPEVKLEDLFADIGSDDDFPSTKIDGEDIKVSSSPEDPPSPLYVSLSTLCSFIDCFKAYWAFSPSFRSRSNAIILPAIVSVALPVSMAKSLSNPYHRLWSP
jgi:hypothetical protein